MLSFGPPLTRSRIEGSRRSRGLSHVARGFAVSGMWQKMSVRIGKLRLHTGKVAMNPVIAVIIVVALIVGSTLSILNKACKSVYHAWCAPIFTPRHHSKTAAQ